MQTFEKIILIMTYLAKDPEPHGVTEISTVLNLSKTTVHRILTSLETYHWTTRDIDTNKYRLGSTAFQMALSLVSNKDIRSVSLPYLITLNDTFGETAMLSMRIGFERIYIDQIYSKQEIRHVVELGKRYPLWLGATGKAILAYMDPGEIKAVLNDLEKSGVNVYASGKVINSGSLLSELDEIRKSGFAISSGERILGAVAVAAPVFNQGIVGAISLAGPVPRFNTDIATKCVAQVTKAAQEISTQLIVNNDNN